MNPNKIFNILDLARRAREHDQVFNPLFVGAPGVGKSHIVQAWARKNNLPFIDLRIAYMEAPDLIGFPSIESVNGRQVTVHNIPEFWPQDENWEGVILLEEPNRGTTSVMNCLMQLLTDRKVHKYELPKKALVVSCINPDGTEYDVNTMDSALKNRFETFDVVFDKVSFIEYIRNSNWNKELCNFIESGIWQYKTPEEVGNISGAKYISPRTWSKLNAALLATFDSDDEMTIYDTILGSNVAKDFYNFRHNESPVMMNDFLKDLKGSLKKLTKFSDPNNCKNGMISLTVRDIIEENNITDEMLVEVCKVIPLEQGTTLIRELEFKRDDDTILGRVTKLDPKLKDLLKILKK